VLQNAFSLATKPTCLLCHAILEPRMMEDKRKQCKEKRSKPKPGGWSGKRWGKRRRRGKRWKKKGGGWRQVYYGGS
jgi:hypothetical protein